MKFSLGLTEFWSRVRKYEIEVIQFEIVGLSSQIANYGRARRLRDGVPRP